MAFLYTLLRAFFEGVKAKEAQAQEYTLSKIITTIFVQEYNHMSPQLLLSFHEFADKDVDMFLLKPRAGFSS